MLPTDRILLFKIGAIGDVLLTTPLVRSLRQRFPRARIDYVTGVHSAPALVNNPHLNKVIAFDDKIIQSRSIPSLLGLAAKVRRRKYDVTFVLDPGWQVGLLAKFFGSFRIGFRRASESKFHHLAIPYEEITHDSLQYLTLGGLLGASSQDTSLNLSISSADKKFAEEVLGIVPRPSTMLRLNPRIALCPGGAKNPYQDMPTRRWPAEQYQELALKLESAGHSIVILGSQIHTSIAEQVATPDSLNLTGQTTLAKAAAVIERCDAVVTHDQGLMHIAATTTTPIISLFGPTDPRRKRPLGREHHVIWHASEPCEHNGKLFQCGPAHDMRAISVAEVFDAVISMPSSRSISSTVPITSSTVIART